MDLIIILIALAIMIAVMILFVSIRNIALTIPEDNRDYLDPLPPLLRFIWPLVKLVASNIGERVPVDELEKTAKILSRSGLDYLFSPEQFFALQFISSLFFSLSAGLVMHVLDAFNPVLLAASLAFGAIFPRISLTDQRKKREDLIIRALPTYLDFIVLAIEAGLNFSGALMQSVNKGPDGPLRHEFSRVLREIKAGKPKLDALRNLEQRLSIKEVSSLVIAIIQAESSGSSVGDTLRIQANQRRVERFQRAEKKALEAPVKLIFPLVAFIFPVTFLILAFPIAMKVVHM